MAATQMDFEGSDTIGNPSGRGRQQSLMYLPGKVETDTQSNTFTTRKESEFNAQEKVPKAGWSRGRKGKNQEDTEFCICSRLSTRTIFFISSFLPSTYTQKSVSLTYTQKFVSLGGYPQNLSPTFTHCIHRKLTLRCIILKDLMGSHLLHFQGEKSRRKYRSPLDTSYLNHAAIH